MTATLLLSFPKPQAVGNPGVEGTDIIFYNHLNKPKFLLV